MLVYENLLTSFLSLVLTTHSCAFSTGHVRERPPIFHHKQLDLSRTKLLLRYLACKLCHQLLEYVFVSSLVPSVKVSLLINRAQSRALMYPCSSFKSAQRRDGPCGSWSKSVPVLPTDQRHHEHSGRPIEKPSLATFRQTFPRVLSKQRSRLAG